MARPRHRFRLHREALPEALFGRHLRRQDLQRARTIHTDLGGPADRAHPAHRCERLDLVLRKVRLQVLDRRCAE
ncbi:MAG: hypothetical protein VCA73_09950 [Roseibacillus sp.]